MRKEIADKWVAALRSGEYKQTSGILANHNRTEHCCLGVLCELAIEAGTELSVGTTEYAHPDATYFDSCSTHLPDAVQGWAGMRFEDGSRDAKGELPSLAAMNDQGASFEDIAGTIEDEWELL